VDPDLLPALVVLEKLLARDARGVKVIAEAPGVVRVLAEPFARFVNEQGRGARERRPGRLLAERDPRPERGRDAFRRSPGSRIVRLVLVERDGPPGRVDVREVERGRFAEPRPLAVKEAVGSATTDNASLFTAIANILGQLAGDTANLDTAQAAAANKGRDEIQARNARCALLKKSLRAARAAVQGLSDTAPDAAHAAAIVVAAGLTVKARPARTKAPLTGKALGNGVVKLYVKVPGKKGARVYYEWRMSADGGKTWTSLPGTNVSTTLVQGLTPGTEVQFASRTTVKNVLSAWSQAISVFAL
jgi:hypothetical protein